MTREEKLWQKLLDEAGEDLIEQAAAVTVAQAEKDLAAWGFDVAAERARAEAFLVSLETAVATDEGVAAAVEQEEAPPKSSRKRVGKGARKKGYPAAVWIAAAAAAVAAGAAVTYVATRPEEARVPTPPPSTGSAAPSPELAAAANLRHRAAAALDEGRGDECLSLLDQAAAKDPAGDATPEVQQLRKRAKAAELQAKPKP
jgi:hypothetical protein